MASHHFTSLSPNLFMPGCANHFSPDCFLNEGQFKAGFVKTLTQGWIAFTEESGRLSSAH